MLKQKIERMERRVTLQKHKDHEDVEPINTPLELTNTGLVVSEDEASSGVTTLPVNKVPFNSLEVRKIVKNKNESLGVDGKQNNSSYCEKRYRRTSSTSTSTSKRKKRCSSGLSRSDESLNGNVEYNNCDNVKIEAEEDVKLKTDELYHTIVGEEQFPWLDVPDPLEDMNQLKNNVEIPRCREKHLPPLYSMEGTENVDDEVFIKRHLRFEIDEKRRKRWDIQRIREQRQLEKLKLREQKNCSVHPQTRQENIRTYYSEDIEDILLQDELNVESFGILLPKIDDWIFSRHWVHNRPKVQIKEEPPLEIKEEPISS